MNISHVVNQLIEAKNELEATIKRLESLEKYEPEGKLTIKRSKDCISFYQRLNKSDTNGRYIRKSETKAIRALVQKRYNHNLKKQSMSNLAAVKKCIAILRKTDISAENVMDSIPKELHRFINTDLREDKRRTEEWKSEVVVGSNPIKAEKTYVASDGTGVRSKSELIIAEALIAFKVPYFYERPFFRFHEYDMGRIRHNLFPDFTCLNRKTGKTYYWEHLGMMDNPEYAAKNVRRIMEYAREGVYPGSELILSFEATEVPLKTEYVRAIIRKYLL